MRRLEPGHVAALLVDPDQRLGPLGADPRAQRRELRPVGDVAGEEHDAAEPTLELAPQPVGRREPLEAREEAGRGEPLEPAAHPLTAPAVSPKAIFRCTIRKKITTGIAVSVAPAISPPQSVWRLVP